MSGRIRRVAFNVVRKVDIPSYNFILQKLKEKMILVKPAPLHRWKDHPHKKEKAGEPYPW